LKKIKIRRECIIIKNINLLDCLVLSSPFLSGLFISTSIGQIYLFYGFLFIFISLYFINNKKILIKKSYLIFVFLLYIYSILQTLLSDTTVLKNILTLTLGIFIIFSYISYIKSNNYDINSIFLKAYNVCFFFCAISLSEVILYMVGIDVISLLPFLSFKYYGLLLSGIGLNQEPAHFGIALTPFLYYSLDKVINKRKVDFKSIIIIICAIFSFSSLAYLGILFSIILIVLQNAKRQPLLMIGGCLLIPLIFNVMYNFQETRMRIDDTMNLFNSNTEISPITTNLSTYTLYVNATIAKETLMRSYLLGTGIDSYDMNYDNNIGNFIALSYREIPGRGDGGSFLIRTTAEFGIIGLVGPICFLYVFFRRSRDEITVINRALFVTLILIYLRLGSYFIVGVPFVLLMYYYSGKMKQNLT